jgi:alpha-beta hydrolase superfamily lysophospholipase
MRAMPQHDRDRRRHATARRSLVRHWPAAGEPWARVLLVHGIHEHSGRYEHVGDWLSAAGLDVTAYDQRGFGRSGGRRAYVERWSQHHDDLEDRLAASRGGAGRPGRPVRPLARRADRLGYVVADPPRPLPDVLVLSAPAIDSTTRPGSGRSLRVCNAVARLRLQKRFDGSLLSRDPAVGRALRADPSLPRHDGRLGRRGVQRAGPGPRRARAV